MVRWIFVFCAMISLCFTTALAQAQNGPNLADWLKVVQKKLDRIVPKKIQPLSTGVTGVRGTWADAPVKLYWKGKKRDDLVTEEEMTAFKAALDLVIRGERAAAMMGMEKFLTQYPDSPLIPDAKKTLDLVKAEALEEKKALAKGEKKEK